VVGVLLIIFSYFMHLTDQGDYLLNKRRKEKMKSICLIKELSAWTIKYHKNTRNC